MEGNRKIPEKALRKLALVLAGAILLISPRETRADILLTLINPGTPSGSNFLYTYDVLLTPGSAVHVAGGGVNAGVSPSNNFFTLYNIPGLIAGSVALGGGLMTNATFTTQNTGVTPLTENPRPPENPSGINITTFWTGADVLAPGMMAVDLGTLQFLSTDPLGVTQMLAYTAATQKLELFPIMVANNTGQVAGPALQAPIPEPATWLLIAIGLPAVGGFYYRRCCRT